MLGQACAPLHSMLPARATSAPWFCLPLPAPCSLPCPSSLLLVNVRDVRLLRPLHNHLQTKRHTNTRSHASPHKHTQGRDSAPPCPDAQLPLQHILPAIGILRAGTQPSQGGPRPGPCCCLLVAGWLAGWLLCPELAGPQQELSVVPVSSLWRGCCLPGSGRGTCKQQQG